MIGSSSHCIPLLTSILSLPQAWQLYNSDGQSGATELQTWLPGGTSGTPLYTRHDNAGAEQAPIAYTILPTQAS